MKLRPVHGIALIAALFAVRAEGALVTNFAASYALYSQCVGNSADFDSDLDIDGVDFLMWQRGMGATGLFIANQGDANRDGLVASPDHALWKTQLGGAAPIAESVCFKLYFDPQGIVNGSVTVVIDAPNPLLGETRFSATGDFGIADANPHYFVAASQPVVTPTPTGQRLTSTVSFIARNPLNPPLGPITLFGYQAEDNLPQLGLAGVQARFEFVGDDFIRVRESTTGDFTVFESGLLDDVVVPFVAHATLMVNPVNGNVSIVNKTSMSLPLSHYEITSPSGSLTPNGWSSLEGQGLNFVEDQPISSFHLAETGGSGMVLGPGMSYELGAAYSFASRIRDLRLVYSVPGSALIPGMIDYGLAPVVGVPEPISGALTALGLTALVAARRRRFSATL